VLRGTNQPIVLCRIVVAQALSDVFNVAIEDQKVDANPVRPKMFFRENNQRVQFVTDEEEARLRAALDPIHWPLLAIAIHTGLRRSEQFQLRWEHVDFATGLLTVLRSKHGGTRRVPMNDTVRDLLRALPSRLKSA
jgi:integrase